jgi:hypothetical protein
MVEKRKAKTKKVVRELKQEDLEQVVGGVVAATTPAHDPSQDPAFLATLNNVAATVSAAAASMHGASDAQAATQIKTVEQAAAAAHVSTDAALANLLGATHGNSAVAHELGARLVSGAAEIELASLVGAKSISSDQALHNANVAVGTLAAYSADGNTALGTSQNAALAVVEAKLDAAAHSLVSTYTADLDTIPSALPVHVWYTTATVSFPNPAYLAQQDKINTVLGLETALETGAHAGELAAAGQIQDFVGGANALAAGLAAGIAHSDQGATATAFGQTATAVAALGGHATTDLVNQITAAAQASNLSFEGLDALAASADAAHVSRAGVLSALDQLSAGNQAVHDVATGAEGVEAVKAQAAAAHTSVDAGLTQLLDAMHGNATVARELSSRLASGAAESELASLVGTGQMTTDAAMQVASAALGSLATHSADGMTALGMSQNAALDIVEAKLDAAAHSLESTYRADLDNIPSALPPVHVWFTTATVSCPNPAYLAQQDKINTVLGLETALETGAHAGELAAARQIEQSVGGAQALAADLQTAIDHVDQAALSTAFGQTATVLDLAAHIKSGNALVADAMTILETRAGAVHVSVDQQLMALDQALGGDKAVHAEMSTRLSNGAAATDIAALVKSGALTADAGITALEAEATRVGTTPLAALGLLYIKLDGDAAVTAELLKQVKGGADLTPAVEAVKAQAAAAHTSVDAALTQLLDAMDGNAIVARELSSRLASGAAESELASLVGTGQMTADAAMQVASAAVGSLATHSADGITALGMSRGAALDVVEAKLDAAAHSLEASYEEQLSQTPQRMAVGHSGGASGSYTTDVREVPAWTALNQNLDQARSLETALETGAHAGELAAARQIEQSVGGAQALAAALQTAIDHVDQAALSTAFGQTATVLDLAAQIKSGNASIADAMTTLETEATRAGTTPVAALGLLYVKLDGDAAVAAELLKQVNGGADLTPAVDAVVQAVLDSHTTSAGLALMAFDKALGGNQGVETALANRLATGEAAELEKLVDSGKITTGDAILALKQEAALVHLSPVGPLAQLAMNVAQHADELAHTSQTNAAQNAQPIAPLGNAAIHDELVNLVKAGADPSPVWQALDSLASLRHGSATAALVEFDTAVGGNPAVAAEIAQRMGNGAAPLDISQALNAGTLNALDAIKVLGYAAQVAPASLGDALKSVDANFGSGGAFHAATPEVHQTLQQAVAILDQLATNHQLVSDLANSLTNVRAELDIAKAIDHGDMTQAQGANKLAVEAALANVDGGHASALLWAVQTAGTVQTTSYMVNGQNITPGSYNADLKGLANLLVMDAVSGHRSDVADRIGQMFNPAAQMFNSAHAPTGVGELQVVSTFAHEVTSGQIPLDTATNLIRSLADAGHVAPDQVLGLLPVAMDVDGALLQAWLTYQPPGSNDKSTISWEASQYGNKHTDSAYAVLALGSAANGDPIASQMLADRIGSGLTQDDLAARVVACTLTRAAADNLMTQYAKIAHVDAQPALDTLGSAILGTALASAISTAARNIKANTDIAHQIATVETQAQDALVPLSAALLSLYNQSGNNAAVSAEIAGRLDAIIHDDEGARIASGALTGAAGVKEVETLANAGHVSIDVALNKLAAAVPNDPAVQAEQTKRVENYYAMADLQDRVQRDEMTQQQALAVLKAEAVHSSLTTGDIATRLADIEAVARIAGAGLLSEVSNHAADLLTWIRSGSTVSSSGVRLDEALDANYAVEGSNLGYWQNLGKVSVDDAIALLQVEGNVLHRSTAEIANQVVAAAGGLGESTDGALLKLADRTHNDPAVLNQIADRFISGSGVISNPDGSAFPGSAEADLALAVARGKLTPDGAFSLVNDALTRLHDVGPALHVPLLPGNAQAEVILGKLQTEVENLKAHADNRAAENKTSLDAWDYDTQHNRPHSATDVQFHQGCLDDYAKFTNQSASLAAFDKTLTDTYGVAAAIGKAMVPLVDTLGQSVAATALQTGSQLITTDTLANADAQAQALQTLMSAAQANHVSVDAALTLASFTAGGYSEMLKLTMTGRLLGGAAEADVLGQIIGGRLSTDAGLSILTGEVRSLAAANAQASALGFDQATAINLVTAKLDMAAAAVHASEATLAGVPGADPSHAAAASKAADLQKALESAHGADIIPGLGVVLGLLKGSEQEADAKAQARVANEILQALLPSQIQHDVNSQFKATPTTDQIQAISQQYTASFHDAYKHAVILAEFAQNGKRKACYRTSAPLSQRTTSLTRRPAPRPSQWCGEHSAVSPPLRWPMPAPVPALP